MELFWHHAPLVRVLAPLLLGLITALRFDFFSYSKPIWIFGVLVTIGVLFSFNSIWKRIEKNHYFGIVSSLAFLLLGASLGYHAIDGNVNIPKGESYIAVVESAPVEKANSYAVNLNIFKVQLDSLHYKSCRGRIIAYISKESLGTGIVPGRSIRFSANISNLDQELYPNQFSYGEYLRNTGISGTAYIPRGSYDLVEIDRFSLRAQLNGLRRNLLERLNEDSIPLKEYGVISALLLGDRSFLDPQLRNDFADAGAVHILAVSGLHVGIIYLFFLSILNVLFKNKAKLLKFFLVLAVLWGYAALTGFSPSVLRAATMFSFIALGKFHNRFGNTYNMIAASALFLLAINPLLITQIGFQLSYLAVIGIVFFHPKFYSLLVVENKYLDKIWSLVCVSVAAQLATFPLSMYYFHQFPTFFLVTNILVIPLASIILHVGIGWILLLWIPYVSDGLGWLTVKVTWVLNMFIELMNTMPLAKIDGIYLSSLAVLLMYTIVVLTTAFLVKPSRIVLRILALSIVCLSGLMLNLRLAVVVQDDILVPTLSESPTVIRLIQDGMVVYAEDTALFNTNWQRELYPYLLTQGFHDPERVRFIDVGEKNKILTVHKVQSPFERQHLLWNLEKEQILTVCKKNGEEIRSESSKPLIHLKAKDLTHFSSD